MSNTGQPSQAAPTPPPSGSSGMSCLLMGCLGAFAVLAILCVGGGVAMYIFSDKLMDAGVGLMADALKQSVQDSPMADEDKRVVIQQVDRVTKAYQDGEITVEQMAEIMNELAESPLVVVAMVAAIEQQYITPSGLSAEEKTQGRRTLERVARGLYEKKISEAELDPAMGYIATRDAQGTWQLKDRVSDEDLRAFLAECQQIADAANIPDESYDVNIGEQVKQAVDAVLEP